MHDWDLEHLSAAKWTFLWFVPVHYMKKFPVKEREKVLLSDMISVILVFL